MKSQPTNEALDNELSRLQKLNQELTEKLEEYSKCDYDTSKPLPSHLGISIDDIEKQEKDMNKEWRKRKRGCMEIIDMVSEGLEKKPKEFIEDLGLETDEDLGLTCPKK